MKNALNTFTLVLSLLLTSVFSYGQEIEEKLDKIHKITGEIISAKVSEMNTTEVKYYYPDRPGIVLAVDNELVDFIILSTGETLKPENNEDVIADIEYSKQRNMAIKLGLFTPIQGYTDFGFEYSRKPLHSIEGTLGIIGLGNNNTSLFGNESTDRGAVITAGYKLYAGPDFHLRKLRNSHRMTGLYVKPTIGLSYFTSTTDGVAYSYNTGESIDYSQETEVTQGAILLQVGRQIVFGDLISIELNGGLGYGFKSADESTNIPPGYETFDYFDYTNNYAFSSFQGDGLAGCINFKLGVLLK